jgi:hypothetical protein
LDGEETARLKTTGMPAIAQLRTKTDPPFREHENMNEPNQLGFTDAGTASGASVAIGRRGDDCVLVRLTVNGQPCTAAVESRTTLLDALRTS